MFKKQHLYVAVAWILVSIAVAGSARSESMTIGAAKRFTFGGKENARIFNADAVDVVSRFYTKKDAEENVTNFFQKRFDMDGMERAFAEFTKKFDDAKEMTEYNFFGYVFTPAKFNAFADSIETEYFTAAKKAGVTSFGIEKMKEVDDFFVTYFNNNATYDVTAAYTSFTKKFPAADVTFPAFQRYFFIPGYMRFMADETVNSAASLGAIAVPLKE